MHFALCRAVKTFRIVLALHYKGEGIPHHFTIKEKGSFIQEDHSVVVDAVVMHVS